MNKKTLLYIILPLALGLTLGIFISRQWMAQADASTPARLEQILIVKELHLIRHDYTDIFFLHRKNDKTKAIRGVAHVPVSITAFLNLKEMKWVKRNDTIKAVVLPRAQLNAPSYGIDQMTVRETRGLQFHVGTDLYPKVSQYLSAIVAERQDSIRQLAIRNQILVQAEAEGKQYVETLLKTMGRPDVRVTFDDEGADEQAAHWLDLNTRPPFDGATVVRPTLSTLIPID